MKIENKIISEKKEPFIIAEIGINHNGKISNAIKMIDKAVEAKCDAVKFQTMNTSKLMIRNAPLAKYQINKKFKSMDSLINKYNLSNKDFVLIKNYCMKKKIIFISTPFDEDSAIFLNKIGVSAFKISSTDCDNILLINQIKKFNKPIVLSTGMTTFNEIKKIINKIKIKKNKLSILHCISDYPTKLKDTKLGTIKKIKKFGYNVGFSDHSIGFSASIAAVALGATIIEKHITLSNDMSGPDHKASLECKYLKDFVNNIKNTYVSVKTSKKKLGSSELETRKIAKKSLYLKKNLKKNHKVLLSDICALRPRLDGISPLEIEKVIGKKTKIALKKNTILKFDYFK